VLVGDHRLGLATQVVIIRNKNSKEREKHLMTLDKVFKPAARTLCPNDLLALLVSFLAVSYVRARSFIAVFC